MPLKITLYNSQRDLPLSQPSVKRLISCLLSYLRIDTDEIIVHFISDRRMKKLHKDFFNDPSSTDCISFPLVSSGYSVLGEVFVCPQTALLYATAHGIDPYEEASRYLIHGILHLIGYDDLIPIEKKRMRQKENRCLAFLKKQGSLLLSKRD